MPEVDASSDAPVETMRPRERGRGDDLAFVFGFGLALLLIIVLFSEYRAAVIADGDFGIIWSGPRALLDGLNPYDPAEWAAERLRLGRAPRIPVYSYPPWVALALVPLGALPLQVAANVWTGLGLACAALALRALLRAHLPGLSALHGLMGFALLASQPGAATFYSGQFGFLLVAAISAAAVLLREGRPSAAGLASLAFPAKPQYFVLAGWALLRAAHARGQARFALPAIGGSAAIVIIAIARDVNGFSSWARNVATFRIGDPIATTLPAAFADLAGGWGVVASAVVFLAAVGIGLRFDPRSDSWLAVWTPLSLLAATYARSYDQVLLIPPLVIAAGVLAKRSRRTALLFGAAGAALFSFGSIALQLVADARGREDTGVALTLGVFALVVGFLWRTRHEAGT